MEQHSVECTYPRNPCVCKQASSEIAQSRDAKEIKKFLRQMPINLADSDWKQVDRFIDAAVENAERDTRERCAQLAEHFLDELTPEEFPPHGLNKASMRWDSGHSEQFVKWVAERIRGKE